MLCWTFALQDQDWTLLVYQVGMCKSLSNHDFDFISIYRAALGAIMEEKITNVFETKKHVELH